MLFQFKAGRTPQDVYLTSVIVLQLFFDRNYKLWTLPFSFKAPILATMCVSAIARWNTDWPHTAQVIFTTYVIFFPSFLPSHQIQQNSLPDVDL